MKKIKQKTIFEVDAERTPFFTYPIAQSIGIHYGTFYGKSIPMLINSLHRKLVDPYGGFFTKFNPRTWSKAALACFKIERFAYIYGNK